MARNNEFGMGDLMGALKASEEIGDLVEQMDIDIKQTHTIPFNRLTRDGQTIQRKINNMEKDLNVQKKKLLPDSRIFRMIQKLQAKNESQANIRNEEQLVALKRELKDIKNTIEKINRELTHQIQQLNPIIETILSVDELRKRKSEEIRLAKLAEEERLAKKARLAKIEKREEERYAPFGNILNMFKGLTVTKPSTQTRSRSHSGSPRRGSPRGAAASRRSRSRSRSRSPSNMPNSPSSYGGATRRRHGKRKVTRRK